MPPYKDKGRWRYRFSFKGQDYSGSTPRGLNTQRAAIALEKEHNEKLVHGVSAIRLIQFVERYLPYQEGRTKPLSYKNERSRVKAIRKGVGNPILSEIDKALIDGMVTNWKQAAVMPRTINLRLSTLAHMLETAREWKMIAELPVIERLKVGDDTPRFLDESEADRLLAAAGKWRPMILLGLRTGMRIGELRGLQWGDLDWNTNHVIVRRTHPGRGTMEATTPKGGKWRRIPLSADAIEVLNQLSAVNAIGWVFPAPRRHKKKPDRPWSERGCHCAILKIADAAGVADVGWHTLRHTFASWLVMRGVPLKLVQEWLGHSTIKQTERYAHLAPGFGAGAVNVLDRRASDSTKLLESGDRSDSDDAPLPDD